MNNYNNLGQVFLKWTKQICKKEERITNSFESHETVIFTKRYFHNGDAWIMTSQ